MHSVDETGKRNYLSGASMAVRVKMSQVYLNSPLSHHAAWHTGPTNQAPKTLDSDFNPSLVSRQIQTQHTNLKYIIDHYIQDILILVHF